MVVRPECHLSPNIMSSEVVLENYTAACNDHNDGYVGVIVIYKKWLKKMLLNSLGVVPIKIETLKSQS